jgi:hypothetical protein
MVKFTRLMSVRNSRHFCNLTEQMRRSSGTSCTRKTRISWISGDEWLISSRYHPLLQLRHDMPRNPHPHLGPSQPSLHPRQASQILLRHLPRVERHLLPPSRPRALSRVPWVRVRRRIQGRGRADQDGFPWGDGLSRRGEESGKVVPRGIR